LGPIDFLYATSHRLSTVTVALGHIVATVHNVADDRGTQNCRTSATVGTAG